MSLRIIILAMSGFALLSLPACSGTKETLGLNKKAPDEFKVVKRAPLAMPPEYNLRPPRPGAPRPQEETTTEQARQVVFGQDGAQEERTSSSAEELFLQELGSDKADPDIRDKVRKDLGETKKEKQPIGTRLFGIGGNSKIDADTVDATEEIQRLRDGAEKATDDADAAEK